MSLSRNQVAIKDTKPASKNVATKGKTIKDLYNVSYDEAEQYTRDGIEEEALFRVNRQQYFREQQDECAAKLQKLEDTGKEKNQAVYPSVKDNGSMQNMKHTFASGRMVRMDLPAQLPPQVKTALAPIADATGVVGENYCCAEFVPDSDKKGDELVAVAFKDQIFIWHASAQSPTAAPFKVDGMVQAIAFVKTKANSSVKVSQT